MAIILADGRAASLAGGAAGVKYKAFVNLAFVSRCYDGSTIAAASITYDKKRIVYFIHGVYNPTAGASEGGTTAFRYESPAVAKAVYNYLMAQIANKADNAIALDMAQDTNILSLSLGTAAAGKPVEITSNSVFINGGVVTLNNITNTEELECVTNFANSSSVSFIVPASVTVGRVYDVIWTHSSGKYAFKLASFTAA